MLTIHISKYNEFLNHMIVFLILLYNPLETKKKKIQTLNKSSSIMYEENKHINKAKVPQGKKAILFQRVFFIKSKRKGTWLHI